jgi:hypothetical protein
MQFIGSNDRATLLGVLEEIDHELKSVRIGMRVGKTRRERDRWDGQRIALETLRWRVEEASKNGPTPTDEQLRNVTLSLTPESRLRLAQAINEGAANKAAGAAGKTADEIANDMLANVDLSDAAIESAMERMKADTGARPERGGVNAVDLEVSCGFCGADLDECGTCTNGLDPACAVGVKEKFATDGLCVECYEDDKNSPVKRVLFDGKIWQCAKHRQLSRAQAIPSRT